MVMKTIIIGIGLEWGCDNSGWKGMEIGLGGWCEDDGGGMWGGGVVGVGGGGGGLEPISDQSHWQFNPFPIIPAQIQPIDELLMAVVVVEGVVVD